MMNSRYYALFESIIFFMYIAAILPVRLPQYLHTTIVMGLNFIKLDLLYYIYNTFHGQMKSAIYNTVPHIVTYDLQVNKV